MESIIVLKIIYSFGHILILKNIQYSDAKTNIHL